MQAQNASVTINIDANANRHAISPLIYGLSYGDASTLPDLNAPVNRMGGNNTSRYNWQLNGDNRGSDWYFESIGDTSATPGERGDTFFSMSKSAGAQAMLTIPMVGWVGKIGPNRAKLASFSIAKYGPQTGNDWQWFPDAGNGILQSGHFVSGNDPNDANVPADTLFQKNWVGHLVSTWGEASNGGLKYYILDNEHSIWHATHRDVHPVGAHASEIRDKVTEYSAMIKALDPTALVVGPEEWGWSGYLYSGFDQQYGSQNGWSYLPDRATTQGGQDYIPWLLSQWKAAGAHPVDVLSVHYYPQGGEFSNDVSTATQLLRNRSTRSLWDPNYVDQSWIGASVHLIPRLLQWVNTYYYSGTPIAITEYNWGAESSINGATTQADIFGIFGREGLSLATRWTVPDASTPTYKAMKMYRNYDGRKSTFGDTSIQAQAPNPDNLSAFAAMRNSDGAMTVVVISKVLSGSTPVTLKLANFPASGTAQVYQLTSANIIQRLSDEVFKGDSLALAVPAQSITLFVLEGAKGAIHQPPTAVIFASPPSGTAPLAVTFSGSASSDSDGTIVSYAWTFGDGSTGTGASVKHSYSAVGSYTATLTVTDNTGSVGETSKVIQVSAPAGEKNCTVQYVNQNDWGNGFLAAVTMTNTSTQAINGWTFTWNFPGTQVITDLWNGTVTQTGKSVKVTNVWYDPAIAPGANIQIGFVANYSGSNTPPSSFTLNGNACYVQ